MTTQILPQKQANHNPDRLPFNPAKLGAMALRHLLTGDCSEIIEQDPIDLELAAMILEQQGVNDDRK